MMLTGMDSSVPTSLTSDLSVSGMKVIGDKCDQIVAVAHRQSAYEGLLNLPTVHFTSHNTSQVIRPMHQYYY